MNAMLRFSTPHPALHIENRRRTSAYALWEVKTAKMQQNVSDPNACLSKEERAARAGLAARIDTAQAHACDPSATIGHFIPIGNDLVKLSGSAVGQNAISALTIAQTELISTPASFDWDGQGYQALPLPDWLMSSSTNEKRRLAA